MRRAWLLIAVVALAACGSQRQVTVPSNHGKPLDEALRRLHARGLRATFDGRELACGNPVAFVDHQTPRAPARVQRGATVTIHFGPSPIPSPAVPLHHPRWTVVPQLVGSELEPATRRLRRIWPCVTLRSATATSATRLAVVAQQPAAGTRVRAYGVLMRRGYRPTTVNLTVAAR